MLFIPTNIQPSNLSFDATIAKIVMWQNNGDKQTDYQLKIYKNSDSTLIYDSTKTTNPESLHVIPANALINGNEYKFQIRVWSGSTYVDSEYVYIKTNNTPIVTMIVPSTITSQSFAFEASYSQLQNIAFQRWKMILYNNSNEILKETDWIYSYDIKYTFDGFENGQSYSVECIVEAQYELIGTTSKKMFNVDYVYPAQAGELDIKVINSIGGIKISWHDFNIINGSVEGTIDYVDGKFNKSLKLYNNSQLTFEKDIPEDFTINFWVKLESNFNGNIIEIGDDFKVGWDSNLNRFYFNCDYRSVCGRQTTLPTDYFKIGIKQSKIIIISASTNYTEAIA